MSPYHPLLHACTVYRTEGLGMRLTEDLLVDHTFAAKQWPCWFGGECSIVLRPLRELGTRLQKFGVLKPPYSATARDIQAQSDSWEKLLQYSYGLLAAVIPWGTFIQTVPKIWEYLIVLLSSSFTWTSSVAMLSYTLPVPWPQYCRTFYLLYIVYSKQRISMLTL